VGTIQRLNELATSALGSACRWPAPDPGEPTFAELSENAGVGELDVYLLEALLVSRSCD